MNLSRKAVLFVLVVLSGGCFANEKPEVFFQKFTQLGANFDVTVAELYHDNAVIRVNQETPDGLVPVMELTGAQWKSVIAQVMQAAKAQDDRSEFSNIVVTEMDDGFKIKADRYSVRKCFTDNQYHIVIQPTADGSFTIVEEFVVSQAQSLCES